MRIFIVVFCCINLLACNSTYTPKPKGYFKIDFPKEHQYQSFDLAGFPYSFDYPTYAKILRDTLFFDEKAENEFWVNVDLPTHQGRIHLSYKDLRDNDINKMIEDAFRLSSKHTSKATNIDEQSLVTQNGIHGMLFSVHGDAATPYQFFLTDSTKHFLRGALYFESSPNEDSMRMVHEFFKKDIEQLINTLKWK